MSPNAKLRAALVATALTLVPTTARAEGIAALMLSAPPPPPTAPELGAPRLHIASDFPITLHEVEPFAGDQIVCQAPCGRIVDGRAGQRFYFAGDEIPASRPFALVEKNGNVLASVHKGNHALLATGRAVLAPAVLHLVAGAVLAPFMALERDPGTALDLQYAMAATLGVGTALLVTSVVMLVEGRTRFRFDPI